MAAWLATQTNTGRVTPKTLEVRETNLPAQLFFRAQRFKGVRVLRSFYEDSGEDAYLMQFRLNETADEMEEELVNRIAQYEES